MKIRTWSNGRKWALRIELSSEEEWKIYFNHPEDFYEAWKLFERYREESNDFVRILITSRFTAERVNNPIKKGCKK